MKLEGKKKWLVSVRNLTVADGEVDKSFHLKVLIWSK